LRILFDKNIPVGFRRFLTTHEVRTFYDLGWPGDLENGDLLRAAEDANFDVLLTADQNIVHQQNLKGRRLALVVLGSNLLPLIRSHHVQISARVDAATPGSYDFIEIPRPPKSGNKPSVR
jgi:hypothetical protein